MIFNYYINQRLNEKKIELNAQISSSIDVNADVDMLATIFRNLISNAIKYSNINGKIEIVASEDDEQIQISVADNGVGISPEAKNKLFRIDESFSTPGTKDEMGTGLGLILCREFVEKHGGKIWVESKKGEGTHFFFTIPK